jgi:hypothetical protein
MPLWLRAGLRDIALAVLFLLVMGGVYALLELLVYGRIR